MFKGNQYLLPTIAIAEAIILPNHFELNRDQPVVGSYDWQQQMTPIVTLDLLPLADKKIKHPKIAILHSVQKGAPYVAVLFTEQARRFKISQSNIEWADANKRLAVVADKKVHTDVVLPDMMAISQVAQLASKPQISK